MFLFCSSRRRHTRCALVTGVQTCALPISYIRRPPYWEGALAGERTMKGMRPLAVLPDNITTDHLSPSNAIMRDSAAGEYLHKMGLPEEDFNSYATHRGDHRSEEHTSELQSLMRISYAVFCLNKKNNKA